MTSGRKLPGWGRTADGEARLGGVAASRGGVTEAWSDVVAVAVGRDGP